MYINGIKYACATCIKGHRSSNCNHVDRPLLEIRKKGRPVTQCALCRDLRKTKQVHIKCACNDKKESSNQPMLVDKKDPPQQAKDDTQSIPRDPSTAPLCPTVPPPKEEDMSYSWALVTSPTMNHVELNPSTSSSASNRNINNYLGFTFHKPPSERFFEGQPRKRRSSKRTTPSQAAAVETPHFSSVPMDMQFLPDLPQEPMLFTAEEPSDMLQPTEELTAILNNVLSTQPIPPPPPPVRSHCGSFVPNTTCAPSNPGESVIITITPLNGQQQQENAPTTTRIVTCYCGSHCVCPGCLVHPNNYFLGNDPYTSPFIPSSSSSCYGSDEELNHVNK